MTRSLTPPDAWYEVRAGSPRVFIYDPEVEDIRHKAIIFAEADSLPSREHEDNSAASAMRSLLQDGELDYKVVTKDRETGQFTVDHVRKPGPAVLITTSTRKLPPQMDSRVFTLDVPDDHKQIQAALGSQAEAELYGRPEPNAALVAFQGYLQAKAPWRVVVPFVQALAKMLGNDPTLGPRVNRDFARIASLIKTVAVLRHRDRARDHRGRLVATIEGDYRMVYALLKPFYEATATGASKKIRAAVDVVMKFGKLSSRPVTKSAVAKSLGLSVPSASWRIDAALKAGWLVNDGHEGRYALKLGEPMPSRAGLPTPQALTRAFKALKRNDGGIVPSPLPFRRRAGCSSRRGVDCRWPPPADN
jgi:hypothetical protein